MTYHENDEGIANYESSDGNTKFAYRKINESDIEIVEWLSSASHIVIPSHIDGNLKVVSLGERSFRNLLDVERIVVPLSVERICFLSAHVCIDNITALLCDAEMRNKFGSYERTICDSLVITLINSPTYNYMTENEWCVASQNDISS